MLVVCTNRENCTITDYCLMAHFGISYTEKSSFPLRMPCIGLPVRSPWLPLQHVSLIVHSSLFSHVHKTKHKNSAQISPLNGPLQFPKRDNFRNGPSTLNLIVMHV